MALVTGSKHQYVPAQAFWCLLHRYFTNIMMCLTIDTQLACTLEFSKSIQAINDIANFFYSMAYMA